MTPIGPAIALQLASAAMPAPPISPEPTPAAEVDLVAAEADRFARLTVPIRLAEHGTYRFLVDTGSQRTVLASEIAIRLALPLGPSLRIVGMGGTATVETALITEIGLGARALPDISVPLLRREHIGADGIVGLDSLQNQRVLLDFGRNMLEIGDARGLGGDRGYEIVVTARRHAGQLIMADATIDGVRTSVVIDTGAGTSIGNRALQQALRQRDLPTKATLVSVTGHEVIADLGVARVLKIQDVGITNLVIAFTDAPPFERLGLARRPALLLGMRELRLFGRVAIDFRTKRVLFDTGKVR
ncbi:MAG TPA: retroviral-like aspartic protease family protein [Novosphingobium sp.]